MDVDRKTEPHTFVVKIECVATLENGEMFCKAIENLVRLAVRGQAMKSGHVDSFVV